MPNAKRDRNWEEGNTKEEDEEGEKKSSLTATNLQDAES